MDVDARLVRHVAGLARLELGEAEVARFVPQMAAILGYVERVAAIPLEAAAPGGAPLDPGVRLVDLDDLRADEPGPTLDVHALMRQAPAGDGAFFVVPRFLGEEDAS